MQSLDVKAQNPDMQVSHLNSAQKNPGIRTAEHGKTGAETARNGSSFLAMIEKMIAGTTEGKADALKASTLKTAARGAVDRSHVPGEENTLKKMLSGMTDTHPGKGKTRVAMTGSAKNLKIMHTHETTPSSVSEKVQDGKKSVVSDSELKLLQTLNKEKKTEDSVPTEAQSLKKSKGAGGDFSASDAALMIAGIQNINVAQKKEAESAPLVEGEGIDLKKSSVSDKKDKKSMISVRDERTESVSSTGNESPLAKSVQINDDGTADMTIGFRSAQGGSGLSTDSESRYMEKNDGKQGQSFASMLSSELRANAADFVKTGSVVLRDNNSGLIRLTLNPESLGNVKISLEMVDKKISGKIIVSSQEAYDAFNENLEGFSDAFVQGGFESAGFDLSWSGQGSSDSGDKEPFSKISSPFYASSIPDVMSDAETADSKTSGYRNNGLSGLNIFA